jgi:hypothetical protein
MLADAADNARSYPTDGTATDFVLAGLSFRHIDDLEASWLANTPGAVPQPLTPFSGFTVSGAAETGQARLMVSADPPLAAGTLDVKRRTPPRQETDFKQLHGYDNVALDRAFDDQARQIGDLAATNNDVAQSVVTERLRALGAEAALAAVDLALDGRLSLLLSVVGNDIDARGTLAGRAAYDAQAEGFKYLATDQTPPVYYIRQGAAGTWSDPYIYALPAANTEMVFDTFATAQAAYIPATCGAVRILGYYTRGDGGEGRYTRLNAVPGTVKRHHLVMNGGTVALVANEPIGILDAKRCGLKEGGPSFDNSAIFTDHIQSCLELNCNGFWPNGTYYFNSQTIVDLGPQAGALPSFLGAGKPTVIFRFADNLPSPNMQWTNLTGPLANSQRPTGSGIIGGFWIIGKPDQLSGGRLLQFGEVGEVAPGSSGVYWNSLTLQDIFAQNNLQSADAAGISIHGFTVCLVQRCSARGASSGGNWYGRGWEISHTNECMFVNCTGGNNAVSIDFTEGRINANKFVACNISVCELGVRNRSDAFNYNIFEACSFVDLDWAIDITNGSGGGKIVGNIINRPYMATISQSRIKNPTATDGSWGAQGTRILTPAEDWTGRLVVTPVTTTQPALVDDTWYNNLSGQDQIMVLKLAGPGTGTLAARPATPSDGFAYVATDQNPIVWYRYTAAGGWGAAQPFVPAAILGVNDIKFRGPADFVSGGTATRFGDNWHGEGPLEIRLPTGCSIKWKNTSVPVGANRSWFVYPDDGGG